MTTKTKTTKNTTNTALETIHAAMLGYGVTARTSEEAAQNARIDAANYLGKQIASNDAAKVDTRNSGVKEMGEAVMKVVEPAFNQFCKGSNVSAESAKNYLSCFKAVGMIATKNPDALDAMLAAANAYCEGKTKKDLDGANKFQVYAKLATRVRDSIWPKTTKDADGKKVTPAARIIPAKEISKVFVGKVMADKKPRGEKVPTDDKPVDPMVAMKATLLEISAKLVDDETVPANVKKALATIAKWK
jgi:hypothetical protein